MTQDVTARVDGIFGGAVASPWPDQAPSAIHKTELTGPQAFTELGFQADAQADLEVHGGVDKAIHHYATDHYKAWQAEGHMAADAAPAAFGENLATSGLTESALCIGDVFTLGSGLVQISQGRQPCWKLNAHCDDPQMAYLFQKTGRTGWYYRVLEPGVVTTGDHMVLRERPCPGWDVARVTAARLTRRISPQDAAILAELPQLALGWRAAFAKMAAGNRREDVTARLGR